ncbi:unnamed protein product, partial [Didymodactylos carnosus]
MLPADNELTEFGKSIMNSAEYRRILRNNGPIDSGGMADELGESDGCIDTHSDLAEQSETVSSGAAHEVVEMNDCVRAASSSSEQSVVERKLVERTPRKLIKIIQSILRRRSVMFSKSYLNSLNFDSEDISSSIQLLIESNILCVKPMVTSNNRKYDVYLKVIPSTDIVEEKRFEEKLYNFEIALEDYYDGCRGLMVTGASVLTEEARIELTSAPYDRFNIPIGKTDVKNCEMLQGNEQISENCDRSCSATGTNNEENSADTMSNTVYGYGCAGCVMSIGEDCEEQKFILQTTDSDDEELLSVVLEMEKVFYSSQDESTQSLSPSIRVLLHSKSDDEHLLPVMLEMEKLFSSNQQKVKACESASSSTVF